MVKVIKVTILRVVHRDDMNLRFAPYEEKIHLDKIVLCSFDMQIMQP